MSRASGVTMKRSWLRLEDYHKISCLSIIIPFFVNHIETKYRYTSGRLASSSRRPRFGFTSMNSYVRCHHLPIFRHVLLDSVFCHQSTPLVASLAVGPTPPRHEPPLFCSEVRSPWQSTSVTIRIAIAAWRSEIIGQLTRMRGNRSIRPKLVTLVGFQFIFMKYFRANHN